MIQNLSPANQSMIKHFGYKRLTYEGILKPEMLVMESDCSGIYYDKTI